MVIQKGRLIKKINDNFALAEEILLDYGKDIQDQTFLRVTLNKAVQSVSEEIQQPTIWIIYEYSSKAVYLYYYDIPHGLTRVCYAPELKKFIWHKISVRTGLPSLGNEEEILPRINMHLVAIGMELKNILEACEKIKPPLKALAPVPVNSYEVYVDEAFDEIELEVLQDPSHKFQHLPRGLIKKYLDSILNICEDAKHLEDFQKALKAVVDGDMQAVPPHLETDVLSLRTTLAISYINNMGHLEASGITFAEIDDFWTTWFKHILVGTGMDISRIKVRELPEEIANAVVGTLYKKDIFTELSEQEDSVFRLLMRSELQTYTIHSLSINEINLIYHEFSNIGSRVKIYLHAAFFDFSDPLPQQTERIENRINQFIGGVRDFRNRVAQMVAAINDENQVLNLENMSFRWQIYFYETISNQKEKERIATNLGMDFYRILEALPFFINNQERYNFVVFNLNKIPDRNYLHAVLLYFDEDKSDLAKDYRGKIVFQYLMQTVNPDDDLGIFFEIDNEQYFNVLFRHMEKASFNKLVTTVLAELKKIEDSLACKIKKTEKKMAIPLPTEQELDVAEALCNVQQSEEEIIDYLSALELYITKQIIKNKTMGKKIFEISENTIRIEGTLKVERAFELKKLTKGYFENVTAIAYFTDEQVRALSLAKVGGDIQVEYEGALKRYLLVNYSSDINIHIGLEFLGFREFIMQGGLLHGQIEGGFHDQGYGEIILSNEADIQNPLIIGQEIYLRVQRFVYTDLASVKNAVEAQKKIKKWTRIVNALYDRNLLSFPSRMMIFLDKLIRYDYHIVYKVYESDREVPSYYQALDLESAPILLWSDCIYSASSNIDKLYNMQERSLSSIEGELNQNDSHVKAAAVEQLYQEVIRQIKEKATPSREAMLNAYAKNIMPEDILTCITTIPGLIGEFKKNDPFEKLCLQRLECLSEMTSIFTAKSIFFHLNKQTQASDPWFMHRLLVQYQAMFLEYLKEKFDFVPNQAEPQQSQIHKPIGPDNAVPS